MSDGAISGVGSWWKLRGSDRALKKIAHGGRGRWRLALEERGGWAGRFSQDSALSLHQLKKFVNRWPDSDHVRRSKSPLFLFLLRGIFIPCNLLFLRSAVSNL